MSKIDIVLASDQRGAEGVVVAAYSAMKCSSRPVGIWVIEDGITVETQRRMTNAWKSSESFDSAQFISINDLPLKFPIWWDHGRWPLVSCGRFQIASILPKSARRCVYLDYDTLTGSDLSVLIDLDMDDCPVAMVPNYGLSPTDRKYVETLGLDPNDYCNSGVMLIDVEKWRREGVADKLMGQAAAMSPKLWFFDQDILNSFFKNRCLLLEERWNMRNADANPDGNVIHFAGVEKPWRVDHQSALVAHRAWLATRAEIDFERESDVPRSGLYGKLRPSAREY